jgi:hypothetical protein
MLERLRARLEKEIALILRALQHGKLQAKLRGKMEYA